MYKRIIILATSVAISGCATVAGSTNMLTDDKIKSDASGVLGYQPDDLTITNRRTDGTNTYVNLQAKDGREFACVINGGNLLTMGIVNPPSCAKKGDPINTNPFAR